MLERMKAGETWSGVYFHGYTTAGADTDSTQFVFYRHRDGVALGFFNDEWQHLRVLVAAGTRRSNCGGFGRNWNWSTASCN